MEPERPESYASLRAKLPNAPLLYNPPTLRPHDAKLNAAIANASLHPAIESALHLLNNDLVSAHFLLRKLQSAPALEGMFLHGVLHRIEADYNNARAWYKNVSDADVYKTIWDSHEASQQFINDVQKINNQKVKDRDANEETRLKKECEREMQGILKWCEEKFGTGTWKETDVLKEYVEDNDRLKDVKEKMLVGGEGWRTF